jgi:hypothetical protein
MSASNPRDFRFPLPTRDDAAEGAFATGTVAIECSPLSRLGLRLERGNGYALRCVEGPVLSYDPDGELRERVTLEVGRPVYSRAGHRFSISADGVLIGQAAAPLRDRSTVGPRLSDPSLSLAAPARIAAEQAIALGQGEVGAGLVLRHGQALSIQVLLSGQDPVAATLNDWWDALDASAREDVSTRTLRAAIRLADAADDLCAETEAEDPGWLSDVAALCRSRDDLHSAARVLQRLAPSTVPHVALASADRALRGLLRSVYLPLDLDDGCLQLAARQSPCWWARPMDAGPSEDIA